LSVCYHVRDRERKLHNAKSAYKLRTSTMHVNIQYLLLHKY
jgi:hypothetical protein